MKLSQAVVVVNEFTYKGSNGNGTRGSTPGDYIMRYMSREGASETASSALVRDADSYVTKYMARQSAAESAGTDAPKQIRKAGKLGGMAFSERSLSLSDEDLRDRSRMVQKMFDDGHTVLKTVLSFDTDYLKENGVLSGDFEYLHRGDFRGQVDQMRLREAIQHGLSKIAPEFDDLRYVGVIQVDTAHVHCHLAMCDFGTGTRMSDGSQRGKLSAKQKEMIRRGVDLALDESKDVQYMARYAGIEGRNVQTALKRHTYEQLVLYGAPQKLLTHLPEDTRLWRAGTNRKEMKAANRICRGYVERVLSGSPGVLSRAEQGLKEYAESRGRREQLTRQQKQALYEKGREDMLKGCMNSVYRTLLSVPASRRQMSTEFLDLSAEPALRPDFKGGVQDMVYRMGSYGRRFSRHRKEAARMSQFIDSYELARDQGKTDPDSVPLYRFFQVEREYHEKVMEKYSQFLFFVKPTDSLAMEFAEVQKKAARAENFRRFLADASAAKMSPLTAEQYGRDAYGIYGGRFLSADRGLLESRFHKVSKEYEKDQAKFEEHLAAQGVGIILDKHGRPRFGPVRRHDFKDIRSLDLHELRGDFSGPLQYDKKAEADFLAMADRRGRAYLLACDYLDRSGQGRMRQVFDGEDIRRMTDTAARIRADKPVPPAPAGVENAGEKKTLPLDVAMHQYLSGQIEKTAEDFARHPDGQGPVLG